MNNFFNTTYAEMLINKGILYFNYLPIPHFDIQVAQHLVASRLLLQKEQAYPIFCDIRHFNPPTPQARKYLAVEGSLLTTAIAYFVKSPSTKSLLRYFLEVYPPIVPSAVFTQRQEAINFLKGYVYEQY